MTVIRTEKADLKNESSAYLLGNGSQVAVIGGGPSGSFFSYFLLSLAERVGIDINIDIYEHKDFSKYGPPGCNHCGGIISESLVQLLSSEGINIPTSVLQRGIDSYILHMEAGSTKIDTHHKEKRIAAVFRGAGPRGTQGKKWDSFDGFLLGLAVQKNANLVTERVENIEFNNGRPVVTTKNGRSVSYDLISGCVGLLNPSLQLFENMDFGYTRPETTKTFICEFQLGNELVKDFFGSSMHVFLLNIPRLDFAALIPKGDFVTLVLLGRKIDKTLVDAFLNTPEVKKCFPPDWSLSDGYPCQCYPEINIKSAIRPFADRIVLIGDCATSKLYKNGIGAAYITAKAAAVTSVFYGISAKDFKKHYWPACRAISMDNAFGKFIFMFTRLIQKIGFIKRGILLTVKKEQKKESKHRDMGMVLWDTFTGSATYMNIFLRTLKPLVSLFFLKETLLGIFRIERIHENMKNNEDSEYLGKLYTDGEYIIKEGEKGDCMYVIQSGKLEVFQNKEGKEIFLTELKDNEFFGEMALFEREVRSASVRAKGEAFIMTVDKRTLLRRIQDDPSLAFEIIEKISSRIRKLNYQVSKMKGKDRRNWESRPDKYERTK